MATQLTVPGLIVKWLVVPAIVGVAGYFLIGSRIGSGGGKATTEQESKMQALATSSTSGPSVPPAQLANVPSEAAPKPHRRKHHVVKHKKVPTVVNPDNSVTPSGDDNFPQAQPPGPGESAPTDSGGSDGGNNQGNAGGREAGQATV